MAKKLGLCVLLCFGVLSLGLIAQEKVPVLELVAQAQGGMFNETTLSSPIRVEFESSEPFFTLHVPPSPRSEMIIFEYGCQSLVTWWEGDYRQEYYSEFHYYPSSSVIPENINVDFGNGVDQSGEPFHGHENGRTRRTSYKWAIIKDGFLNQHVFYPMNIRYKSGGRVPDAEANEILNNLIKKGFDLKVTVFGMAEGVRNFYTVSGWIYIMRPTLR